MPYTSVVDDDGAVPKMMVQAACVRRIAVNDKYSADDYEVLLVSRVLPPFLDHFTLPSVALRKGEAPADASIRALKDQSWLDGHAATELDCHVSMNPPNDVHAGVGGGGGRGGDGGGAWVSLLHHVACSKDQTPSDLEGLRATFHSLGGVLTRKNDYPMAFDHRAHLGTVDAWIGRLFSLGRRQDSVFGEAGKVPVAIKENPLFAGGDSWQTGEPVESTWHNPYFAKGELKPHILADSVTRHAAGAGGVVGNKGPTSRFRSRRSETLMLLGQYNRNVGGGPETAAENRHAAADASGEEIVNAGREQDPSRDALLVRRATAKAALGGSSSGTSSLLSPPSGNVSNATTASLLGEDGGDARSPQRAVRRAGTVAVGGGFHKTADPVAKQFGNRQPSWLKGQSWLNTTATSSSSSSSATAASAAAAADMDSAGELAEEEDEVSAALGALRAGGGGGEGDSSLPGVVEEEEEEGHEGLAALEENGGQGDFNPMAEDMGGEFVNPLFQTK